MTISDLIATHLSDAQKTGRLPIDVSAFIRAPQLKNGTLSLVLDVPAEMAAAVRENEVAIKQILTALEHVENVSLIISAPNNAPPPNLKIGKHGDPRADRAPIKGVKHLIAIGSGKGGVGKSTVSTNLAVASAALGLKTGLLDADIYGPSLPQMMGVSGRPESPDGKEIIPLHAHGVTVMSLGFMVAQNEAVIWRGPMLMGALQQMLMQVRWGELDVLFVDLPPGTGDVQLTLSQKNIRGWGCYCVNTARCCAFRCAKSTEYVCENQNTCYRIG